MRPLVFALSFGVFGMGFGYVLGGLFKKQTGSLHLSIGFVPVAILTIWLVLLAHELGHVLGGWIAGFRFQMLAVGPLRVELVGGRLEVRFNRAMSLWGGIAASSPVFDGVPDVELLRQQMLKLVAGGPLTSLAGIGLFLPAVQLWGSAPNTAGALFVFALFSATIAVATLLPMGNSGFVNDGARILQLLRRDRNGMRWLLSATLGSLALQTRPRDWPKELVEANTADREPTYDGIMSMWMRHCWHLDRREYTEAKHWLELALSHADAWPKAAQPILHSSAADYFARIEPDLERARAHFEQASKPGFLTPEALAVTEAALRVAEGKPEIARALTKSARKYLESLRGSSRTYVEEILTEIESRSTT